MFRFLRDYRLAVWSCLIFAIVYSFLLVYRYLHFAYSDWDTAFYTQYLWNLWHGNGGYSSVFDHHCFGSHAEFISLLLLPFFGLFKHPLFFSFVEVLFFSLSGCLLYLLIEKDLPRISALLILLAYLIFPANFFGLTHDACPEGLAPFFFLMLVFFYRRKELAGFYLSALLFVLIKENMSLVLLMFGLRGAFSSGRNRVYWGLVPILFASIYFIAVVKWVIPYFRGSETHPLWVRFRSIGETPETFFLNLFRAETWARVLFSQINMQYLAALFGVLLLPALLSPSILFLVAPIILYHLLSVHFPEKTIYYYYGLTLTPAIFLAAVQTVKKIRSSVFFQYGISALLLVGSAFHLYSLSPVWMEKIGFYSGHDISGKWELVNKIPPDAGVIATFGFLPALSLRKDLHSFHKVYDREYQDPEAMKWSDFNVNKIFKVPDHLEYALIDFNDSWLQARLQQDAAYVRGKLDVFFKSWEKVGASGTVILFKRPGCKDEKN